MAALNTWDGRRLDEALEDCHARHNDAGTKELTLLVQDLTRHVEALRRPLKTSGVKPRLVKKP